MFHSIHDPASDALWKKMAAAKGEKDFFVTVSMFQVRAGYIVDLLNPQSRHSLDLLDDRATSARVHELAELQTTSREQVISASVAVSIGVDLAVVPVGFYFCCGSWVCC